MANLTETDRIRIHDDMDQLTELIERKQVLWEQTHDAAEKEQLMAEIEQHQLLLALTKAQLQ